MHARRAGCWFVAGSWQTGGVTHGSRRQIENPIIDETRERVESNRFIIVRLFGPRRSSEAVHLLVECKGASDDLSKAKADYARDWWIPAVGKSPQTPPWLRTWHFVELSSPEDFRIDLDRAFERASDPVRAVVSQDV